VVGLNEARRIEHAFYQFTVFIKAVCSSRQGQLHRGAPSITRILQQSRAAIFRDRGILHQ
jgi:hypothetical protein